jgi:hypothetical protein
VVLINVFSRILLAISAMVLAFGAWIHTSAFGRVSAAVAKSDLPAFLGNGFKTLWLQDSALQIVLAIVFWTLAIRPFATSKPIVLLIALIPAITTALIYYFIGNFVGGHVFLAAAISAILGGLLIPGREQN